ncbi:hypothetical protein OHV05_26960 [Kitasatospora sp. NBC_00070]|uniref:hypothetical protein n=1 Tax=Kitasatospora sp. NBC_00070 TaxID=2975962 RepID=UPI00325547C6
MPLTTPAERAVPLGRTFTSQVPLGAAGDLTLTCHSSTTGKGKLHGAEDCGRLGSAPGIVRVEVPLREAVGRLCGSCCWPVLADSLLLELGAAVVDVGALKIWLDQEPDPEHEAAQVDAASALAIGEYPPAKVLEPHSGGAAGLEELEDDDWNDEEWQRFTRAREIRLGRLEHWRRLHTYMIRSNDAVLTFPHLQAWAEPLQVRLASVIEQERRAFAALLRPASLVDAAAVRLLGEPRFVPGPEFAGLGEDAPMVVRRAWSEWERRAGWSWRRLEENGWAVASVVGDAFGRRRKGRPQAEAAFDDLVAGWISDARAQVSQYGDAPRQLIAVKLPPVVREPYEEKDRDSLGAWECAVIATYQVAAHWQAATVAVLVPHLVAEQLLDAATSSMPVSRLANPDTQLPADELLRAWRPETGNHED